MMAALAEEQEARINRKKELEEEQTQIDSMIVSHSQEIERLTATKS
jgi:hypothetical protein